MPKPRFCVTTCTGYLTAEIEEGRSYRGPSRDCPHLTASVLDRLYCYREVAAFRSEDRPSSNRPRARRREEAIAQAQALADELNAADL